MWYNEASLDTDFITSVKKEAMKAVTALGSRATPRAVAERLKGLGVAGSGASRSGSSAGGAGDADGGAGSSGGGALAPSDVAQLLDSLVYEGWLDYAGSGPWRVGTLARAERTAFPSRKLLIDEKVGKKKPGKGAVDFDDDDDGGDAGDDGGAGDVDPSERVYVVVRKSLTHLPAAADLLTTVPCGTCPVMASCKPGGIVSPETCVYMSHWLQW